MSQEMIVTYIVPAERQDCFPKSRIAMRTDTHIVTKPHAFVIKDDRGQTTQQKIAAMFQQYEADGWSVTEADGQTVCEKNGVQNIYQKGELS